MADSILAVQNLQVQFQGEEGITKAVDDISFTLPRGQTLGIVGESGSGKSVTALSLMGLVPSPPGQVVGGEVWFEALGSPAVNLLALPEKQLQRYRGSRISMIFQEPMSSLNPVFTCGFQLTEALLLHKAISEPEARREAIALLQEVKLIPEDADLNRQILAEADAKGEVLTERQLLGQINERKQSFLRRYPHELSGGQIQRIMIAMAISCNPAVLIADEPTTALDVTVQAKILDLLRELRDKRGMSIIFVSHDLGIIAEIADTVAVMYGGKIVEYGSIQQIFNQPQHPYTKGLLACRPQPSKRLKYLPTVTDFMETVLNGSGQAVIQAKDESAHPRPVIEVTDAEQEQRLSTFALETPLLAVENLQVFFPVRGLLGQAKRYVMAVNDVSFQVRPGETLGLVGESGCGKTTLGRALVRLIEPTGGKIWFEGQNLTQLEGKALRRLRQDLQIIFQDPYSSLNPRMSVGAIVMEPMRIFAKLSGTQPKQTFRDRAAYLLERVGLQPKDMRRYPHEFSGGQRQRICIARSLALNPKFIVCDESVSALDVSVQAQVLNLLKELQQDFNLTYLFISHDLSVVKFMSDRIMVMNQGKIEEIGPAERIYQHPQQDYTRQLIAAIPSGKPPQAA
ncbi:MAG: ABC transporter ATP-binding protein [Thermosynechococcaceae cyanobacterium MS004]|nr:ABC transporter ATP-binding protein [Thermosynechococcaceae cyanobacterium MS004]